jgi:hypothetical protein
VISNFHAGAEVDVFYRITNNTDEPTSPTIYLNRKIDPDKYPKAVGYEIAPFYVEDWLELPSVTVAPGKTKDTIVKMVMPDNFGKTPPKMAFCTGVAEDTGGMYQTAVETWWLVEMR